MKLIGYYNKSVYLTYLGLASSVFGMVFALEGKFGVALSCLLFSGLCDMFDGTVAQHVPRNDPEKKFGIQIDSLCDVVCFCVFPALLTYSMGAKSLLSQVCMAFFVTCGVIRLGYFNVQEEMRQEQTDEKRTSYQGLPVTTTALIFPAVVSLLTYLSVSAAQVLPVLLVLIGIAFIADISVIKPQGKGKLLLLAAGILIFAALLLTKGRKSV